jgi:hypothetical protein
MMPTRALGLAWLVALNLFVLWQVVQEPGTVSDWWGSLYSVEAIGLALLIALDLFIVWRIASDDG